MASEAAFAELYETHYRRVRALCRKLLGSAERAEDAAQEAFVRAYRGFAAYDGNQPFGAWIMTIASNHCIDVARRRGREPLSFGAEAEEAAALDSGDDALAALVAAERGDAVNAAIEKLPERYRVPLVLAYFADASYDEIAARLGLTRTHVGVLICRAKQALRKALAEEGRP